MCAGIVRGASFFVCVEYNELMSHCVCVGVCVCVSARHTVCVLYVVGVLCGCAIFVRVPLFLLFAPYFTTDAQTRATGESW